MWREEVVAEKRRMHEDVRWPCEKKHKKSRQEKEQELLDFITLVTDIKEWDPMQNKIRNSSERSTGRLYFRQNDRWKQKAEMWNGLGKVMRDYTSWQKHGRRRALEMDLSKVKHFRETDCNRVCVCMCARMRVSLDGWLTATLSYLSDVNLNSTEIPSVLLLPLPMLHLRLIGQHASWQCNGKRACINRAKCKIVK